MHRTRKAETCRPPEATVPEQQHRFDAFRFDFNTERPHEALGNELPASLYEPSERCYPSKLPKLEYAGDEKGKRGEARGVRGRRPEVLHQDHGATARQLARYFR